MSARGKIGGFAVLLWVLCPFQRELTVESKTVQICTAYVYDHLPAHTGSHPHRLPMNFNNFEFLSQMEGTEDGAKPKAKRKKMGSKRVAF